MGVLDALHSGTFRKLDGGSYGTITQEDLEDAGGRFPEDDNVGT